VNIEELAGHETSRRLRCFGDAAGFVHKPAYPSACTAPRKLARWLWGWTPLRSGTVQIDRGHPKVFALAQLSSQLHHQDGALRRFTGVTSKWSITWITTGRS
jgi:hypothetical protein